AKPHNTQYRVPAFHPLLDGVPSVSRCKAADRACPDSDRSSSVAATAGIQSRAWEAMLDALGGSCIVYPARGTHTTSNVRIAPLPNAVAGASSSLPRRQLRRIYRIGSVASTPAITNQIHVGTPRNGGAAEAADFTSSGAAW